MNHLGDTYSIGRVIDPKWILVCHQNLLYWGVHYHRVTVNTNKIILIDCPKNFFHLKDQCGKREYAYGIESGAQTCIDANLTLWAPKSDEENMSVHDQGYSYYLGIVYMANASRWMYLSDNSNVTYFNWALGQPVIRSEPMTCVYRHYLTGEWATIHCLSSWSVLCVGPEGMYYGLLIIHSTLASPVFHSSAIHCSNHSTYFCSTVLIGFNKFGFNESSRFNKSVLTSKVF